MRIATPAVRTEANWAMLLSPANSVVAARITDDARIETNCLFAGLVQRALGVRSAFDISFRNCLEI